MPVPRSELDLEMNAFSAPLPLFGGTTGGASAESNHESEAEHLRSTGRTEPLSQGDHRRSRNHWFWVSKVDPVAQHTIMLPDGFVLGTMSNVDFSEWIKEAPTHVQESIVCNVTWWRSKKAPLHHQFVIITVASHPEGVNGSILYDVRIERIGKGVGFRRSAVHSITVSRAEPLSRFEEDNDLIAGLFHGFEGEQDEHGTGRLVPPTMPTIPAFVGTLDEKWRGPPAALGHVGHYVNAIIRDAPRYNLASSNCYYFARLLVYAISLRHYSFTSLAVAKARAVSKDARVVDNAAMAFESSISQLFLILTAEERLNGVLLYERLRQSLFWGSSLLWFIGLFLGWLSCLDAIVIGRGYYSIASVDGYIWWLGWLVIAAGSVVFPVYMLRSRSRLSGIWVQSSRRRARAHTLKLVKALDSELEANTRAWRGDFDLHFYNVEEEIDRNNRIETARKIYYGTTTSPQHLLQNMEQNHKSSGEELHHPGSVLLQTEVVLSEPRVETQQGTFYVDKL